MCRVCLYGKLVLPWMRPHLVRDLVPWGVLTCTNEYPCARGLRQRCQCPYSQLCNNPYPSGPRGMAYGRVWVLIEGGSTENELWEMENCTTYVFWCYRLCTSILRNLNN